METSKMAFSPQLEIGLPTIDEQHKEYVNRLNIFMEKCEEGIDLEEIYSSLEFFQIYAIEHFDCEEYLMKEKNYPAYDEQKKYHEYFCNQLDDLTKKIKTDGGFCEESITKLRELTIDWFTNHIQQHDSKIAEFINAL